MSIGFSVNTLNHTLECGAGTHLDKFLSAIAKHVLHCCCPAHRSGKLLVEVSLDFGGVSYRHSVDILIARAYRCLEDGLFDGLAQLDASRLHKWRMESSTNSKGKRTAFGFFHQLASLVDTLNGAANNQRARSVIVGGDNDFTLH